MARSIHNDTKTKQKTKRTMAYYSCQSWNNSSINSRSVDPTKQVQTKVFLFIDNHDYNVKQFFINGVVISVFNVMMYIIFYLMIFFSVVDVSVEDIYCAFLLLVEYEILLRAR
jgi:uncharacterized membrane protein YbhN (UPF0104 family)